MRFTCSNKYHTGVAAFVSLYGIIKFYTILFV